MKRILVATIAFFMSISLNAFVDPTVIDSKEKLLQLMDKNDRLDGWDKDYILTADLDMTGGECKPIGLYEDEFTGTFEGNGHTISNVEIVDATNTYVGFFG